MKEFREQMVQGGRLAVDYANAPCLAATALHPLSWEELIVFLQVSGIVSAERAEALLELPQSDPQAAQRLLGRANRLREVLRRTFNTLIDGGDIDHRWVEPINEILRVTEGHDEIENDAGKWRMQFVARESSLDWLLAAVARSAAEMVVEGAGVRLRRCANPGCALMFCDNSRTHQRRWCCMAVCGNRHKVANFARRRP